jgi:hypothetical protein
VEYQTLYESNVRELTRIAGRTFSLLSPAESLPDVVRYHLVIRCLSELRQIWSDHLMLQSQDPERGTPLESELISLSSASWPRCPKAAMSSIHGRVTVVLTALVRQMETERKARANASVPATATASKSEDVRQSIQTIQTAASHA